MPCSLSRWTGACGQSLGGASRLMSLVTGGLRAKLFGDDGKYSSMTAACSRSSPFTIALLVKTVADDVAQRLECAELAPALGRLRPSESASKLVALHTLRESECQQPGRAGRAAGIPRSVWSARS